MTSLIKAAALIQENGAFLLVQENVARVRGRWNWPQGTVKDGETPEQTAIREAKEETGLDIKIERRLAILTDTFPDTKELHVYLATAVGGGIFLPKDEILDVQYFTFEQIEHMKEKLVGEWIFNTISENR